MLVRQNDAMTRYRSEDPDLWSVGGWDRLATSIVSTRVPYMYSTSAEGLVLQPHVLSAPLHWDVDGAESGDRISAGDGHGGILCCYPRDGNSMGQLCEKGTARAASYIHQAGELRSMLSLQEEQLITLGTNDLSCLWLDGGEHAEDRSECRYNEVVLSASHYHARLPQVIEAIFYPVHGPVIRSDGSPERAARARDLFVHRFGRAVPLLAYDVSLARQGRAPFRMG